MELNTTIFIEYPITGEFRFIAMILEWIFAIICLEFGLLFLFRHKKAQYGLKYSQNYGYIILFFALSSKSIFSVLGSYFSYNITIIHTFHFISNISLYFGFILFTLINEKRQKFLFQKYVFSVCLSIILILFISFQFLINQLIIIDLLVFLSLVFIFFLLFYLEFIRKAEPKTSLSMKFLITIVPFSLLMIGLFLASNYTLDIVQIPLKIFGLFLQLIGIVFFTLYFLKYPILSEFDWKDKIEEVLLINKEGACLFYKSYIRKVDIYDENLISGAISLINIMLKEIMKSESKDVSLIKKKDKFTYIFQSDLLTGVIFSTKESKIIEFYLKQLVMKIEAVYKNILLNWDGDLGIFDPIEAIFEELFSK